MKDSQLTKNERFIAVILGTAREIVHTFTKEERKKMAGVYIYVDDKGLMYDWDNRETLGSWIEGSKTITYYLNSLRGYVDSQKEEEKQMKFKSIIEHELLHALGYDHEGIVKYRKEKKKT